jgi:hypothetical protein
MRELRSQVLGRQPIALFLLGRHPGPPLESRPQVDSEKALERAKAVARSERDKIDFVSSARAIREQFAMGAVS